MHKPTSLSLAFLLAVSPPALFLGASIVAVAVGAACGDASPGTGSGSGSSGTGDACTPSGPALPFGPCGPGCSGDICVDPLGDGDVCAVACSSEADCDAGVTCTPGGAEPSCVLGWCVIPCSAASSSCPEGMTCHLDTQICVWPGSA